MSSQLFEKLLAVNNTNMYIKMSTGYMLTDVVLLVFFLFFVLTIQQLIKSIYGVTIYISNYGLRREICTLFVINVVSFIFSSHYYPFYR